MILSLICRIVNVNWVYATTSEIQIAVTACSDERKHQNIIINSIYQKPIWGNVTFTKADPIAGKRMILIFFGKSFSV